MPFGTIKLNDGNEVNLTTELSETCELVSLGFMNIRPADACHCIRDGYKVEGQGVSIMHMKLDKYELNGQDVTDYVIQALETGFSHIDSAQRT